MATQAEIDTLTAKITEAEEAYHQLQLGCKAVVVVDQNGERVEFQRTSPGRLAAYIQTLKNKLAECKGQPLPTGGPALLWGSC